MQKYVMSKQLKRALLKAEREIQEEGEKQLDIVLCSGILSLNRYWNWKEEQIVRFMEIFVEVWNEVGSDNDISVLKLLDEECDIELTNHEGVSYRDVIYLNVDVDPGKDMTPYQWLAMRQNQKKWIESQITACVCLAMSRKEGWGFNRVRELLERMQDIKEDFDYQKDALIAAVLSDVKFDYRKWIEELNFDAANDEKKENVS